MKPWEILLNTAESIEPAGRAFAGPGRLPAAVLWDMDGTLVDSEPYWIAEEYLLVESFGGRWSHAHAMALVGRDLLDSAAYIVEHSPVALPPEAVVQRLVRGVQARLAERTPWRPGARELLAELRAAGVPTALVTMSYRSLTDALERALPPGAFDVVVSGQDVSHGKPDPEPYLLAASLLGVDPQDCVAIEDSEAGALSASAAGARTLVIPNVKPVPPLPGVVPLTTLVGLTPAVLWELAGRVSRPQSRRGP
ncbi:MAG: HAD family phosphatase [Actinomycetales bacterium]|nr:HAD family phosphatase [Actinomycetales bacterium]